MKFALTFAATAVLYAWSPVATVIAAGAAIYLLGALFAAAFCSIGRDVDCDEEGGVAAHRSAF
jgi:hypothetical protein